MATSAPVPSVPRRRSFAGAIVLIILGLVFLLGNMGVLTWSRIFYWFAHYWPVLLIIWGVVKLLEYFHAQRSGYASPGIGAGGVFLLIFVVLFGMAASYGARHDWSRTPGIVIDGEEVFPMFGNAYTFQEEAEHAFVPGNRVEITSARGNVSVLPWDEPRIKIVADKRIQAERESDAQRVHEQTKPQITATGNVVGINIGSVSTTVEPFQWSPSLRTNVQIFVPRKAPVKLVARRGDVTLESREGEVEIEDSRGNITVRDVKGNATIRMKRGDVRAEQVAGNVTIEGRADDVTVADVSGTLALLGDFFGQTRVSRVGKAIRFSSSRTEMETGRIDGELSMDSGDLRASQLAGMKIRTRSKDIHLDNISGDVEVANRNASIELMAGKAPLGNISINNDRGGIQIYLPSGAAFQVEARTRGGDIQSDFDELKVQESGRDSRLSGSVGSAGSKAGKVQLTTEHGDIEIRKGS
ncbi:MAG: DUF4097 family beta strand repeat-containing protein [Acidobacteriales bacterium]|nr:DUF4097 family beta strand repeat-containing protein [Terriglobales bacterium]